jgi:hypothetical protein
MNEDFFRTIAAVLQFRLEMRPCRIVTAFGSQRYYEGLLGLVDDRYGNMLFISNHSRQPEILEQDIDQTVVFVFRTAGSNQFAKPAIHSFRERKGRFLHGQLALRKF